MKTHLTGVNIIIDTFTELSLNQYVMSVVSKTKEGWTYVIFHGQYGYIYRKHTNPNLTKQA